MLKYFKMNGQVIIVVKRHRLKRMGDRFKLNPFRGEKIELLGKFNTAVKRNNPEEARMVYDEMKNKGFVV